MEEAAPQAPTPAYVWLTWLPAAGMLLVAFVFGELASHYPIAGALYQYSKYNVGRRYGWFGCAGGFRPGSSGSAAGPGRSRSPRLCTCC